MMDWTRLLALAPLAGALVTAPVSAQDDDEWSDDDPLVVIDEHLQGLDNMLDFSFGPGMDFIDDRCEDKKDCDVRVVVKDGKRLVIVNGDTVSSGFPMPHDGAFAYHFGPRMDGHGPRFRFDRDFTHKIRSFRDQELRKLEQEAHSIARNARRADRSEKADLEKQLDQKLNEIFDYKLELRKKAISKAQKHVAELKERQARRKSAREEIIKKRKDELLGMDSYLEW